MNELVEQKAKLLGSLLLFTQVFFKIRTGREFQISKPVSNQSHFIDICRDLTKVFKLQILYELINLPPGWAKSELCKHFVAWALARYSDSNFLYISVGHELAAKHTHGIKQIIELPHYKKLFGVEISRDTSAKDYFKTTNGGVVAAFGAKGTIVGYDAGLPNLERFSGAIIMDDMHKPDEVFSDTIRERVVSNYFDTIKSRKRGVKVPIIFLGQRLHEDDLPGRLLKGVDGNEWNPLIIKALDDAGNARYPELHPKEMLLKEQEFNPYVFSAQYQQNPQPAGGGIFKPEWFVQLDDEPEFIATFITADTAETDKNYNDPTVFSFFGIYHIKEAGVDIDLLGLHWIDCYEFRCEPKDLEGEFRQFYSNCLQHRVKPQIAAIEKKSTGVTLISVLSDFRGLKIIDIDRTKISGNKIARYFEIQPYVASKRTSLLKHAKHTPLCLNHMRKITANNSHRHDDIADTFYDGVKIGLIDEVVSRGTVVNTTKQKAASAQIMSSFNRLQQLNKNNQGMRWV